MKDETANNFIASPGSTNQFIYGSAATCSTNSSGNLICNNRYLCKNGTNYRFYTNISSYLPFFIYKVPAASSKTLSSISVSTAPTKTTYIAGEFFDPTGLVITRTYSDSSSDTYTYADHTAEFTFSPTTSTALTTSNKSVIITYSGKSCSQAITVNAAPKTLSSISVSTAPSKTTYQEGEYFDPTGLVISRHYSDNTSDTYSYANHTSEFDFDPDLVEELTTSDTGVTITYNGKSTTQAITVNAIPVTLTSISVNTAPSKTSYEVGECFDPTGLVISRHYSNGSSDTYSYVGHTSDFSFDPDLDDELTVSDTCVTITYNGKSTSQSITVTSSGGGQIESEYSLTGNSPYINGVPYKMYFYSTSKKKNYYFTGSLTGGNNQYGSTTDTIDSSVVDVYFEESGSGQNIYFSKNDITYYLQIVKTTSNNKTYYNFGYSTTEPSIKWMFSEDYTCLTFSMDEHIYSFGNYSNYTNFSGYDIEAHDDNYKMEFITSTSEGAIAFATTMNDNIKCVASGLSEPSLSGCTWEFFSSVYSHLDESSQALLRATNPTDAEVLEFVTRYDYIVGKYGTTKYGDFLNRNPDPVGSGAYNLNNSGLNDNNFILIISIVLTASMSLAILLILKKKKHR